MAQLQQDLTFTLWLKLASPACQNESLSFFFTLQSVVDQMWNCNKDL